MSDIFPKVGKLEHGMFLLLFFLQLEQCYKTMISAPEQMPKLCLLENTLNISHEMKTKNNSFKTANNSNTTLIQF